MPPRKFPKVNLPKLNGLPRPIALDLFCGGGGVGVGLSQAGYKTVVGVDWKPRPNYAQKKGMVFVQGDIRGLTSDQLKGYDLLWASPSCQLFSGLVRAAQREAFQARWQKEGRHINHIPFTRRLFLGSGLPYIIENVAGAKKHLRSPIMLCGSMDVFKKDKLRVLRRRLFESNMPLVQPEPVCSSKGLSLGNLNPHGPSIARPRTEKLKPGTKWVVPSGFQAVEVRFPSHEKVGHVDHIYRPTTPLREKQLVAMFKRKWARSLFETMRASGLLVPMTKQEIESDKKRYEKEIAKETLPSNSKSGKHVSTGKDFVQAYPVYGLNASRGSDKQWSDALGGVAWMTRDEMRESIPPAYARYLGKQAIKLASKPASTPPK